MLKRSSSSTQAIDSSNSLLTNVGSSTVQVHVEGHVEPMICGKRASFDSFNFGDLSSWTFIQID